MTKDRISLDAIEAKLGTKDVDGDEVEAALRRLVPNGLNVAAGKAAEDVVDRLDVHDRAVARENLYAGSIQLLRRAFIAEATGASVIDKSLPCDPSGSLSKWRPCSRKSRTRLVLPDGKVASACFQHEDAMRGNFASQRMKPIFAEASDSSRIITYHERHEAASSTIFPDDRIIAVGLIWKRLAERVSLVSGALPEDGPFREEFTKSVEAFESKWGAI